MAVTTRALSHPKWRNRTSETDYVYRKLVKQAHCMRKRRLTLRNCEATLLRASAGHSLNQSMVQQLTRLGNLRRRALHTTTQHVSQICKVWPPMQSIHDTQTTKQDFSEPSAPVTSVHVPHEPGTYKDQNIPKLCIQLCRLGSARPIDSPPLGDKNKACRMAFELG